MSLQFRGVMVGMVLITIAVGCNDRPQIIDPGDEVDAGVIPVQPEEDAGTQLPETDAGTQPPETDAGVTPIQYQQFEVRLLGVNADAYSLLAFDVAELTASAGGVPLAVELAEGRVDLAVFGQAWLVGTIQVPEGTDWVDLALRFDDAAAYEAVGATGSIDARRVSLRWRSEVAAMQQRGRTVVHLDIGRSLVSRASWQQQLLPVLTVVH